MNRTDLSILLQEGEGSMLEYKESLSSALSRELVAFANTTGGKILLGVRDDGSVKGITDTNDIRARIQDIARNCDPPVKILLTHIDTVTIITVRESSEKPVQCSDGFFWRQGAVTQKLTREEIRTFFQKEGAIRFELSVSPKFRYPEDLDEEKFTNWLSQSGISPNGNQENILVNIETTERSGGKLLFRNVGILFFAKDPRRFFNQAYITCILFQGTTNVRILDRKDFAGGAVADIEDSLRFIERNTRLAYKIEGLKREEIPEYPMASHREAITNAVMHRDWFIEGANVFVQIFSDRIEIISPGGLPPGMQQTDLGHKSVRRNPIIADLYHRIGFIEKAGTGIERMREGARESGCPEPVFDADGFFTVTFTPMETPEDDRHQDGTKIAQRREKMDLLKICQKESTLVEILSYFGRTDRTKFRKHILQPLVEDGLLELTIPDRPTSKNQKYRITPAGKEVLHEYLSEITADKR